MDRATLIEDLKDYVWYYQAFTLLGPWRMWSAAKCILIETRRRLIQDYGMAPGDVDSVIRDACHKPACWDSIRDVLEKEELVVSN